MAALISLPRETQEAITEDLNYLDLTRFRMSCRHMRDLPTVDTKRHALVQLERDWLEAVIEEGENLSEEGENFTMGVALTAPRSLGNKGYLSSEADAIQEKAPCYTCLTLKSMDDFEAKVGNEPLAEVQGPNENRECINCLFEKVPLAKRYPTYIFTQHDLILACTSCDKIEKISLDSYWCPISGLQKKAQVCTDCFAEVKATWTEHRLKVEEARHRYKSYLRLMREVESGSLSADVWAGLRDPLPQPPALPNLHGLI